VINAAAILQPETSGIDGTLRASPVGVAWLGLAWLSRSGVFPFRRFFNGSKIKDPED